MERLSWIKDILNGDPKKVTKKFVRSVAGSSFWLPCFLSFGWLRHRLAAFEAGKEVFSPVFQSALVHTTRLVRIVDSVLLCFFIALEVMTRSYGCGIWTEEEIADATRAKAVSSTYLEVLALLGPLRHLPSQILQ